jgi:hypothetical protein
MPSKGLKCTFTFLARWAILAELAQECGVKLSEDELQRAAMVAEAISGFSFEKLWFRGLGLIN